MSNDLLETLTQAEKKQVIAIYLKAVNNPLLEFATRRKSNLLPCHKLPPEVKEVFSFLFLVWSLISFLALNAQLPYINTLNYLI